jgi:hypothetical protein
MGGKNGEAKVLHISVLVFECNGNTTKFSKEQLKR